jgi:hypothetical protein
LNKSASEANIIVLKVELFYAQNIFAIIGEDCTTLIGFNRPDWEYCASDAKRTELWSSLMQQADQKSPPGKHVFKIIVNGTQADWDQPKMNYEQAVKLAFPSGPSGGDIRYNVSWTKPDGQEGSLRPGSPPVDVVNGMILDVRNTDKS